MLDSQLVDGIVLAPLDWALVAALPFAFTGLAMLAARVAVLRRLARVL